MKVLKYIISLFPIALILFGCANEFPDEVEAEYAALPELIDFNLHIRPILADRCYSCHGPDKNTRKAALELHHEVGAFATLESGKGHAFVAGNLSKSNALQRMLSDNPEEIMPPPESNLTLSSKEIATIAKWIDQGAEWKDHWAFIPPIDQKIDPIEADWKIVNPIDYFVYKKLISENLLPEPEADKERLLRRVTRDLTGLPPSIEEIDNFLADQSPDAYEKVVDRLLQTEAYGERMAMEWMDVARYADSHGMHADGWRMMWPWRDWVIDAFNKNLPYDQFATWQLAGDLLPNASKEQILATAFHRNHAMTAEGGAIDEEFRLEYVFDRTNTTSTAFMGLTMECARCHDHKFDPISQEEYFQMTAFFNNVKELGMTGDDGNYGPMLLLTDEETDQKLAKIQKKIEAKEQALIATKAEVTATANFINNLNISTPIASFPINSFEKGKTKEILGWEIEGAFVDQSKLGFITKSLELIDGRDGKVLHFDEEFDQFYIKDVGLFEMTEPYSTTLWINTSKKDSSKTQVFMGTAGNKNSFWRGWDFYLDGQNKLNVRLIHSLPHNYIHVTAEQTEIPLDTWTHVAFTYDGSGKAEGLQIYINGQKEDLIIPYNKLYKNIHTVRDGNHAKYNRPITIGRSGRSFTGENGIFEGKIDEVHIFKEELSPFEITQIAKVPATEDLEKNHLLRQSPQYKQILAALKELRTQKLTIIDSIPEIMVMEETPMPRPTFVLNRGQYDAPAYEVKASTPQKVLSFPDHLPKNRLGLAKWLFSEEHPLTSRVTVNRYWQLFFGNGLVKTPQDFGSQGTLPIHPEMLDWLALDFQTSGWDLKALCKKIVLSSTYRQSSKTSKEKIEKDPQNDFLARGPNYRISAEMIRDNALASSGLLVKTIGGESVKPYQPDGLWYELGNFSFKLLHYKADEGDKLYRRSMYTFIRRTSPPPSMATFDAPNRDVCTVKREITNTPLQALVLLNDPQFVEAAKAMAERMLKEGGEHLEQQIVYGFRLATSRKPSNTEIQILKGLFEKEKERFEAESEAVDELLNVGAYKIDAILDPVTIAALTSVASTLLNHDDAYMKR